METYSLDRGSQGEGVLHASGGPTRGRKRGREEGEKGGGEGRERGRGEGRERGRRGERRLERDWFVEIEPTRSQSFTMTVDHEKAAPMLVSCNPEENTIHSHKTALKKI